MYTLKIYKKVFDLCQATYIENLTSYRDEVRRKKDTPHYKALQKTLLEILTSSE
jgi:hypothetical protein